MLRTADTILQGFRQLSACNISDGLKSIRRGGGVLHSLQPLTTGARLCGRALPAMCTIHPDGHVDPEKYRAAAIPAAVGLDDVLVIENDGRPDAVFGLVAAHVIAAQGGAGVLVNGGVRDVDAISATGLSIFGRQAAILSAYGSVERELVQSVTIDGVEINRGDIVVGERGGIVVVPREVELEVLDVACQFSRIDRNLIEGIQRGERLADLWTQSSRSSVSLGQSVVATHQK